MKLQAPMKAGMRIAIAGAASLMLTSAHAGCYTVYKGTTRLYHAQTAPVDTSLPYSETVPMRFGDGAVMIVSLGAFDCPVDNELQEERALASGQRAKEAEESARTRALNRLAERHTGSPDNSFILEGARSDSLRRGTYDAGPILTGPRGGQFYWNGSGGKTYVSGSRGRQR